MGGLMPDLALGVASLALDRLKERPRQRQQDDAGEAGARQRIQEIEAAQDVEERDRQQRLRRVLAARRAAYGAQGVASAGGSAAAVLEGLAALSDAEGRDSRSLADARVRAIEDELARRRRRSLLDERAGVVDGLLGVVRKGFNNVRQVRGNTTLIEF